MIVRIFVHSDGSNVTTAINIGTSISIGNMGGIIVRVINSNSVSARMHISSESCRVEARRWIPARVAGDGVLVIISLQVRVWGFEGFFDDRQLRRCLFRFIFVFLIICLFVCFGGVTHDSYIPWLRGTTLTCESSSNIVTQSPWISSSYSASLTG